MQSHGDIKQCGVWGAITRQIFSAAEEEKVKVRGRVGKEDLRAAIMLRSLKFHAKKLGFFVLCWRRGGGVCGTTDGLYPRLCDLISFEFLKNHFWEGVSVA